MNLKRILFLSFFVLFTTLMITAQDTIFMLEGDGETPAIEHTRRSVDNPEYDYIEQYTDPGAVVYHDGQFHMFRNGFRGWPSNVWIHYMVSDDGINWEQPSDTPVLLSEDVTFATRAALASSVHVEDDGTWVLYFYTWNSRSFRSGKSEIGRATASDPQGPWTVDDTAILSPDDDEGWDNDTITAPLVLKTGEGYVMYYEGGAEGSMERGIGMATSTDGIEWTKSDNNPILTITEDWEGNRVHQPRVIQTDEGWLMLYRAEDTNARNAMTLGLATSDDGVDWTKSDKNPILTMDMLEQTDFYYTAVEQVDDTVYLFIELLPGADVTDIYVMTTDISDLLESQ